MQIYLYIKTFNLFDKISSLKYNKIPSPNDLRSNLYGLLISSISVSDIIRTSMFPLT